MRAALLLLAGALAAAGQTAQVLHDEDAAKLQVLLRAERSDIDRRLGNVRGMMAKVQGDQSVYVDLQSGKRRASELIAQKAPEAVAPPGAVYDEACSRAWAFPPYVTAVFAGPARGVEEFYRAKGLEVKTRSPIHTGMARRGDEGEQFHIVLSGAYADEPHLDACAHLKGKPVVMWRWRLWGTGESPAEDAVDGMEPALKRAGITEERYRELQSAVMMARMDARNPNVEEELKGLSSVPDLRLEAEVRRRNLEWYRRHAAVLEPLLQRMDEVLGGSKQ